MAAEERTAGGNVRRTLVILSSWTLGCAAFAFGIAAEALQNTETETREDPGRSPVGPASKLGIASVFAAFGSILIPTLTVSVFGHRLYKPVTTKSVLVLVLSWVVAGIAVILLLVAAIADSREEKTGESGVQVDQNAPWGAFAGGGILSLISATLVVAFQLMSFKVSGGDQTAHHAMPNFSSSGL